MSRKYGLTVLIISVIALCLSIVNLCITQNNIKQDDHDVQYVMFLGTNDKDTNEPVCSPDEAKKRAEEILVQQFGGYTIQEANGGWKDDEKIYNEYTLVIYLSDTTLDDVHAAARELIRDFNQSTILIQTDEVRTEFYSIDD
ncbi:MAG: DUF3574 domain-containing protein [Lachnospiraceae bacterium]|nr:DUF3574 domain-containing protein [Lachnospiraceae bacterium]